MLDLGHTRTRQIYGDPKERFEAALEAMQQAYATYCGLNDLRGVGRAATAVGTAWKNRISDKHAEDLEKSIEFHREAISLATVSADWPTIANAHSGLGLAYTFRERGDRTKNIIEAVRHTRAAADKRSPARRRAVLATGEGIAWMQLPDQRLGMRRAVAAFRRAAKLLDADSYPADARRLGRRAGSAHLARGQWHSAREFYDLAVQAAHRLVGSAGTEASYRHERAALGDLYAHAVYATARSGDLVAAAKLAEEARARVVSVPQVPTSGSNPDWEWIHHDEVLLYVVSTAYGGGALAVRGDSAIGAKSAFSFILCPSLNRDVVRSFVDHSEIAAGHGGTVAEALLRYGPRAPRQLMKAPLAEVMSYISTSFWRPVLSGLPAGAGRIHLIPFGPLVVLPIHAAAGFVLGSAGPVSRPLSVSYPISSRIGSRARTNAATGRRRQPTLLAVGAGGGSGGTLEGTGPELKAAREAFPGKTIALTGSDVSLERIYDAAGGASHVHLACHGVFDPIEPPASYFELAGGDRLTVERLLADRPFEDVSLLVATACAMGSSDYLLLPDEPAGLPAAAILSGVGGVIAPLRVIPDLLAPLFTSWLYDGMFASNWAGSPATTLAAAQNWLRWLTAGDLREWLTARPYLFPQLPSSELLDASRTGEPLWADEPDVWAPFCYFGA